MADLCNYNPKDILGDDIYLNNAATSFPKSKIAIDSFFLASLNLNACSRQNSSNIYLKSMRSRVASILNQDERTIFFTSSATLGLNQVILGYSKPNTILAIDNRSHNAVVQPWLSLAGSCKAVEVELYNTDDTFQENKLIEILVLKPHLLVLSHVSNITGSIFPVEMIIKMVNKLSPETAILVDASQSAGFLRLKEINKADFIVFPSHKHLHSFPGAAVIVAKRALKPIIHGGMGADRWDKDSYFAEVGTMNYPAIQAMVDSLEFAEKNMDSEREKDFELTKQFIQGLKELKDINLIGRKEGSDRLGIVALKPKYGSPEFHWVPFLRSQNIYVRGGIHCSPIHHKQLGLLETGSLRFSFGWNTTAEDVEKALFAIKNFCNLSKELYD